MIGFLGYSGAGGALVCVLIRNVGSSKRPALVQSIVFEEDSLEGNGGLMVANIAVDQYLYISSRV